MDAFTLITGASHGIGRALAFSCARRSRNLLLVALPDADLDNTAGELREQFPVRVETFGVDLTEPDAPARVASWCRAEGFRVNMLINNAGVGTGGRFEHVDWSRYPTIMRLNNQAMVGMCYEFLPELKTHPRAHLLNLSSIEATLPLPYKAVYTGSKSFVYAFSLALREELRPTGVRVTVACPSSVVTNEEGLKRIEAHGRRARLIVKMPDEVAETCLQGLLADRATVVPGAINGTLFYLGRVLPNRVKLPLLERLFRVYRGH
ncbi:MAG: SDR family NAD(P)-dependent oxidoreductase [Catalinimonas sp.]